MTSEAKEFSNLLKLEGLFFYDRIIHFPAQNRSETIRISLKER